MGHRRSGGMDERCVHLCNTHVVRLWLAAIQLSNSSKVVFWLLSYTNTPGYRRSVKCVCVRRIHWGTLNILFTPYAGLNESLSEHVPQFIAHCICGSDLLKMSRQQLEYLKVFPPSPSFLLLLCTYLSTPLPPLSVYCSLALWKCKQFTVLLDNALVHRIHVYTPVHSIYQSTAS